MAMMRVAELFQFWFRQVKVSQLIKLEIVRLSKLKTLMQEQGIIEASFFEEYNS